MKEFKDLEFKSHPLGDGIQAVMHFEKGFGVSVVQTPYSYGGKMGLYELAVIDSEGQLVYDTPVADGDVAGYLQESEVTKLMLEIQKLK